MHFDQKTFKPKSDTDWATISCSYQLSEDFLSEYGDKLYWPYLCVYQSSIPEKIIEKYSNKLSAYDWLYISAKLPLSEEFIEKYKDNINYSNLSVNQKIKLSEDLMEKHSGKLDWYYISIYQSLSEPFIEKYKKKVNWTNISRHQKLSEKFIKKYFYYLDMCNLLRNDKVSQDTKDKITNIALEKIKLGSVCKFSYPLFLTRQICAKGVKFTLHSSSSLLANKDKTLFYVTTQYSKKVILKEFNIKEKEIVNKLKKIIKEKQSVNEFDNFDDWADYTPESQIKQLHYYVGCGYSEIKDLDRQNRLRTFIKYLKKMPKFKTRNNVFYRGMSNLNDDFFKNKNVGKVFKIDALTSVSSSVNIAKTFAKNEDEEYSPGSVLMKIKASNVKFVGCNFDEKEGLLLKGTKLLIKDIKKKKSYTEYILEEMTEPSNLAEQKELYQMM